MKFKEVDKLNIDVKEAVKKRVSTRSFEEKALSKEDKNRLMDFYNSLTNPFDVNVRVQYISKDSGADGVKLGTYGTIKGAKDYPAEKRSLLEKLTRAGLGSKNRKAFDKIFFSKDFDHALSMDEAGEYEQALEMLRLAPSATNAQPWAVVKEGNKFHFFCKYKNNINEDMIKIKHLDLGIALSHFHQTAMSDGLKGKFEIEDVNITLTENMHYVISYIAE